MSSRPTRRSRLLHESTPWRTAEDGNTQKNSWKSTGDYSPLVVLDKIIQKKDAPPTRHVENKENEPLDEVFNVPPIRRRVKAKRRFNLSSAASTSGISQEKIAVIFGMRETSKTQDTKQGESGIYFNQVDWTPQKLQSLFASKSCTNRHHNVSKIDVDQTSETPNLSKSSVLEFPTKTRNSVSAKTDVSKTPKKNGNLSVSSADQRTNDDVEPSTSSSQQKMSPKKRRTFELEETVTALDVLRKASTPGTPDVRNMDSTAFTPGREFDFRRSSNEDSKRSTLLVENSIIDTSVLKLASEADEALARGPNYANVTLRRKFFSTFESVDSPIRANTAGQFKKPPPKTPGSSASPLNVSKPSTIIQSPSRSSGRRTKVKIPNFALIHQRNYEKMENLQSYQLRKNERAQVLLSGNKPKVGNMIPSPSRGGARKKQLRFVTDAVDDANPLSIPLPNTPYARKNKVVEATIVREKLNDVPNPFDVKKATQKQLKLPIGNVPKEGYTKFGFRSLQYKQRPPKNVVPVFLTAKATVKRTDYIKGVRSNRRFDLLMQMRNKS